MWFLQVTLWELKLKNKLSTNYSTIHILDQIKVWRLLLWIGHCELVTSNYAYNPFSKIRHFVFNHSHCLGEKGGI